MDIFWDRVNKNTENGCWLWIGLKDKDGYGLISIKRRHKRTHRYSWELHNGPIPTGILVLHHCDIPACVNPSHLFLGTHQDNVKDRVSKDRTAHTCGTKNGNSKLTYEDICLIRFLRKYHTEFSLRQIAEYFHIAHTYISRIEKLEVRKTA